MRAGTSLLFCALLSGGLHAQVTSLLHELTISRNEAEIREVATQLRGVVTPADVSLVGASLRTLAKPDPVHELDPYRSEELIRVLGGIPGYEAEAALARLLGSIDLPLLATVVQELLDRDEADRRAGREVLGDWVLEVTRITRSVATDADRRVALIEALRDPRAAAFRRELATLWDEYAGEDATRAAVLRVLTLHQDPRGIELARQALAAAERSRDETPLTLRAAISALLSRSEESAIAELRHMWRVDGLPCPELAEMLEPLSEIRRAQEPLRELLLELLDEPALCTEAQLATLRALGRAGEERARQRALELAEDEGSSPPLREAAVRTVLAVTRDEDERKASLAKFRDHEIELIRLAVAEREWLEDDAPAAMQRLCTMLASADLEVAAGALATLRKNKAKAAIPILIDLLPRASDTLRPDLAEALQAHLDCFFPYRTPRLEIYRLGPDSSEAERTFATRQLRAWWEAVQ